MRTCLAILAFLTSSIATANPSKSAADLTRDFVEKFKHAETFQKLPDAFPEAFHSRKEKADFAADTKKLGRLPSVYLANDLLVFSADGTEVKVKVVDPESSRFTLNGRDYSYRANLTFVEQSREIAGFLKSRKAAAQEILLPAAHADALGETTHAISSAVGTFLSYFYEAWQDRKNISCGEIVDQIAKLARGSDGQIQDFSCDSPLEICDAKGGTSFRLKTPRGSAIYSFKSGRKTDSTDTNRKGNLYAVCALRPPAEKMVYWESEGIPETIQRLDVASSSGARLGLIDASSGPIYNIETERALAAVKIAHLMKTNRACEVCKGRLEEAFNVKSQDSRGSGQGRATR